MKRLPLKLPIKLLEGVEPHWDVNPANFHLVHDGQDRFDYDIDDVLILSIGPAEVVALNCNPMFKGSGEVSKFRQIAKHWREGQALTPPMIVIWEGRLTVPGGNHRLNLAHQVKAARIPLIAKKVDLPEIEKQLGRAVEFWTDHPLSGS